MKNIKKVIILTTLVTTLGISGIAFATSVKSPAEVISGITGKKIEDVSAQRESGKTYGTIAKENGKLDEFKTEMLEQKKAVLDARVNDGSITKERAEQVLNIMRERQATCDGSGQGDTEKHSMGTGMGRGRGNGSGFGMGNGQCMMGDR